MSNLLDVKKLSKSYQTSRNAVTVLKEVNLTVSEGDRIAILGRSGTGKSTLLHILGALESPTSGSVRYQGKELFQSNEGSLSRFRNREVGFVFQFHYLMLEFNALENVMMPALISGVDRSKALSLARELLKQVGLEHRLTHRPGQLSGGEQQRVAIARALMMRPKLLLTDEMTGNLDPTTVSQITELIERLHHAYGMAMISVTHDEALASRYPKIYRLVGGSLEPA